LVRFGVYQLFWIQFDAALDRLSTYQGNMRYQRAELPLKLDGLVAAREFFAGCFAEEDRSRERLWVAHVDDQAHCLHLSCHEGDETGAAFPIRQIIADAAVHGSAGIVLAHNHPSGDPRPSDSDCRATRRLATAAEALDCTVLDHLVFAGHECTSLRRLGYL
jgi:DNA repair protein RadC